ncbi:MAG: RHS repeat-associated core domain-containing protein, partial [Bacteroidales bacterium]
EKMTSESLNWLDYGARFYDPQIGRWHSIDPLPKPNESVYAAFSNNPIVFPDPNGSDTLDIVKNNEGKWIVSNKQIVKGDDVFRVKTADKTQTYTFSEGEYGKRVNVLNLENNDDYTLGIYHISGAEKGGTDYTITPGGGTSTGKNSGKRLPPDSYILGQGDGIWQQPWVLSGVQSGDVSERGIKFHFGYGSGTKLFYWTKGCFVLSSDYSKVGNTIIYIESQSRQALRDFDRNLGAISIYNYNLKGRQYTLIGAKFGKPLLDYKLILKDGF